MTATPSAAVTARREIASIAGLCAGGGGLALLAASRPWLRLAAPRRPPLPDVVLALTGRQLEPLVPALGVVGLAGVVGLLATRRRGRLAVGIVLAAAGLAVLVRSLSHVATPEPAEVRELLAAAGRAGGLAADPAGSASVAAAWPLLAALGGLLLAAGGLGLVLRGRRWPALSARYEPPAGRPATAEAPAGDAALWDALDTGHDPTAPERPRGPG